MHLQSFIVAGVSLWLLGCSARQTIFPNPYGHEYARVAIAAIPTSEERKGCYARALSGDSHALFDALFDPLHRDPDYNTPAEPPIVRADRFLEALGDIRFSEAVETWSDESKFSVAVFIMQEGAGDFPMTELYQHYPRTARVLNIKTAKGRLRASTNS